MLGLADFSIEVLDDVGQPTMTVRVVCNRCRVIISTRRYDARLDSPDSGGEAGEAHARACLAHRCDPR